MDHWYTVPTGTPDNGHVDSPVSPAAIAPATDPTGRWNLPCPGRHWC